MFINFGKLKGQKLVVGDNKKMKPTQTRVKSVIFNILNISENDYVLDLFAGTGSLGFESVSLGAKSVIWIDSNYESVKAIKANINKFKLDKKMFSVYLVDFRQGLNKLNNKFTIIFLDPPFIAKEYYNIAFESIIKNDLLADDGVIVLEKRIYQNIDSEYFFIHKIKKISNKELVFVKKK